MPHDGAPTLYRRGPGWDWFVGREELLGRIVASAQLARREGATCILVEGGAGLGKTTLARRAAAALPDFVVLDAACDPTEAALPLGAFSQVARQARHGSRPAPGLDRSRPARTALEAGAELLSYLEAKHGSRPTLIIIDDLQWIDQASADAFGFLVRRLRALPVVFVACYRSTPDAVVPGQAAAVGVKRAMLDRPGSLRIRLAGLSCADITALARAIGLGAIEQPAADRIREHTDGNSSHVTALLHELPAERLLDLRRPLPSCESIMVEVRQLLHAVPDSSRQLAEALAVFNAATPLSVAGQVGHVVNPIEALEPLLARDVVRWWPEDPATPVQISTGVYRDAIYQILTPRARHALHLAVAGHMASTDPWLHRVAATGGPDPMLAASLAEAADASDRDGNAERAARLMLWAVDLTSDRAASEQRLIAAARFLCRAGKDEELAALLPRLEACTPSPARDLMLGLAAYAHGRLAVAESLLSGVRDAGAGEPTPFGHPVELVLAAIYAHQDEPGAEQETARSVLAGDRVGAGTASWAQYYIADAIGRRRGNPAAALRALAQLPVDAGGPQPAARWGRGIWQVLAGRTQAAVDELRGALHGGSAGDLCSLGLMAHACLAYAEYATGSWDTAHASAVDAVQLARLRGRSWPAAPVFAVATCVAAGRGELEQAREYLREAEHSRRLVGLESWRVYPAFAAAALAQAEADHAGMLRAVNPLAEMAHPRSEIRYLEAWWRPLHVEALLALHQLDPAAESLRELARLAEEVASLRVAVSWFAGWLAHLNGDLRAAAARYEEELSGPVHPDDNVLHRARLNEFHARVLLEQGNRRGAVAGLRRAHDTYVQLRARPYLDRCLATLRAGGLEFEQPAGPSLAALSERELRVARLVAAGLTNKETAQELYVSPKTIEYHLGNIFSKLGISSRRELRVLLPNQHRPEAGESRSGLGA